MSQSKNLTPELVRRQIGRLETQEMRLQMNIPKEQFMVRKNRMIQLLEQIQAKKRELYFILHHLEVSGKIAEEREEKLLEDWEKRKCPKCEQAKLDDENKCPKCGFQ